MQGNTVVDTSCLIGYITLIRPLLATLNNNGFRLSDALVSSALFLAHEK
ncbi:MAG: DUF3368 domain-containing protein [Bacteroidetes bacterium]|nr:DUF3368 domain-containing protein [Bacteroidota bacterium]